MEWLPEGWENGSKGAGSCWSKGTKILLDKGMFQRSSLIKIIHCKLQNGHKSKFLMCQHKYISEATYYFA